MLVFEAGSDIDVAEVPDIEDEAARAAEVAEEMGLAFGYDLVAALEALIDDAVGGDEALMPLMPLPDEPDAPPSGTGLPPAGVAAAAAASSSDPPPPLPPPDAPPPVAPEGDAGAGLGGALVPVLPVPAAPLPPVLGGVRGRFRIPWGPFW